MKDGARLFKHDIIKAPQIIELSFGVFGLFVWKFKKEKMKLEVRS